MGGEFLRSKKSVENSYNAGDSINAILWSLKKENFYINNYIKELIKMRKEHPAFRMTDAKQVAQNILFDTNAPHGTVVYTINGKALHDTWKKIFVAFNGSDEEKEISLPGGNWKKAIDRGVEINSEKIYVKKYSPVILYQ